jgi:hypothetical protein
MQTVKNLAQKRISLPLPLLVVVLGLLLVAALPHRAAIGRGLTVAELALRAYLHVQNRRARIIAVRLTLLLLVGLGLVGLWLLARGG